MKQYILLLLFLKISPALAHFPFNISQNTPILSLLLDVHSLERFMSSPPKGLFFHLNKAEDFFNIQAEGFQTNPGYHSKVYITTEQFITSKEFASYGIETRNCRFEFQFQKVISCTFGYRYTNETLTGSLFKEYSYKSCMYQCRLALAEEIVGCYEVELLSSKHSLRITIQSVVSILGFRRIIHRNE